MEVRPALMYGLDIVVLTIRQEAAGGSKVEDVKIFIRSDHEGQDFK